MKPFAAGHFKELSLSKLQNGWFLRAIQSCKHGFGTRFFPKHEIAFGHYPGYALFIPIPRIVLNTDALIQQITIGPDHIFKNTALHPGMQI
jgi:hypothetical protein